MLLPFSYRSFRLELALAVNIGFFFSFQPPTSCYYFDGSSGGFFKIHVTTPGFHRENRVHLALLEWKPTVANKLDTSANWSRNSNVNNTFLANCFTVASFPVTATMRVPLLDIS